ncbi:hypothetical protein [Streptomyces sp. NPDC046909]|uniref:hypothetical protein n=1 Tax=Streptomyces sp. NPDC046909 TaxID=3155617 RepID=UPI0033F46AB1
MTNSPNRGRNLCSMHLFIDSNVLIGALYRDDENAQRSRDLLRLWEEGWIGLSRTDTLDTERLEGQDDAVKAQRLMESADLPEALGAMVWDNSRWDHAVWGTAEDGQRIHEAFAIIFPNKDWTTANKNSRRDAMHVATAARYAATAFVTNEKAIYAKDEQILARLGIRVWNPQRAVDEVMNGVAALRRLHALEPERGPLPD